jgi:glyoxylase-like metal-dependent hydrolase (beta-lactamase superfamily II)
MSVVTGFRIHTYTAAESGIFVTHAHPDHFNGLPYLVGEDVPVYAAAMIRFLPDAPLSWLVGLGADAVAAELATDAVPTS